MAHGVDGVPQAGWSDALSAAWERHRTRLFESQRHVSEWLVDRVGPRPGQTVLELAAGPGETGFLVAERVAPGGTLISTDREPGMVDAARRGAAARGLTNVEFRMMDAQAVDLADASVDGALCRFGLMLVPEPDRVLAGARRVLRPGGRLAYAVWGAPERNPRMALLAAAAAENGHQLPGDPLATGGVFSLADPARNRELVLAAGFGEPEIAELPGVVHFEDFDDCWDFQTQVSGPLALFVSSLPDDEARAVRESLRLRLEPYRSGRGYELPTLAVAVAVTAP